MIVLDASAGVRTLIDSGGLATIEPHDPCAPRLFWSEVSSSLRQIAGRGVISTQLAGDAFAGLLSARVRPEDPPELPRAAWAVADRLGWVKAYDAEYVALAQLLGCPLVTTDARLARGAGRRW